RNPGVNWTTRQAGNYLPRPKQTQGLQLYCLSRTNPRGARSSWSKTTSFL
ncbi:unnamed protein product, partial [Ectocarpus sp. 13 AM-2016]